MEFIKRLRRALRAAAMPVQGLISAVSKAASYIVGGGGAIGG